MMSNNCAPLPLQTSCGATEPPAPTFYVFSSPPKPVWGRPIYRNNVPRPRGAHDYYNIMWDPHVRRGDAIKRDEDRLKLKKCLGGGHRRKQKSGPRRDLKRSTTPPPVEGRKHFDTQTENYLEDLEADKVEFHVKTQTEALHELPVVPWFVPSKIGHDQSTHIESGDLFDFDTEVKPLVETFIGKVVEQALLEVMEEEELQSLKDQQNEFEERRRLELVRLERLREREELVNAEKERLMQELEKQMRKERETEDLVAAHAFAALYLTKARAHVLGSLEKEGFLNAKSIIANAFVPWLNCEVEHVLAKENLGRALLDDMLKSVSDKREAEFAEGMWVTHDLESEGRPWSAFESIPEDGIEDEDEDEY